MPRKARPRDPLLLELIAALGAGCVDIGPIHDASDRQFIHGVCEGQRITINPHIDVVDSVLHEQLHAIRPTWSERAVRSKVTRLMRSLSDHEVDRIYAIVTAVARPRRTVKQV